MLDFERYLDELRHQGELLRRSASRAGLPAAVPSCPGWTVAQLLRHVTKVHHWAASILQGGQPGDFEFRRPDDGELLGVYDAGLADLLARLRSTPDSRAVWTMLPAESARLFWARRQAHETAIHRVDAELAAGFGVREFEPEFAADGIDELLAGLSARGFGTEGLTGERTISVTPLDANASWTLSAGPDGVSCRPAAIDRADLSVFGLAGDLYRWVWNRAADDEVALRGELRLADYWRQNFRIGAR